jgi:hypothetical protein
MEEGVMNEEQAVALKSVIEAGHPDAGTTVTAQPDGVRVTISGPVKSPGLSGPGGSIDVELRLREDGPFMTKYLMVRAARAAGLRANTEKGDGN